MPSRDHGSSSRRISCAENASVRALRRCSARYSAVGMKRQKTMGRYPSSSSPRTAALQPRTATADRVLVTAAGLSKGELGLDESVAVNPSGGPLSGNPMFSAGLVRIGEAASRVMAGTSDRALGHATSGPALQQNLVCVMEGRN